MQKDLLEKSKPMDGPSLEENPSELKAFLKSDHSSPFLKRESLKESILAAQQAASFIDETDTSGQSLYDFLPVGEKEILKASLETLNNPEIIKETLETNLNALAPNLWEDHKEIKKELAKTQTTLIETLLLGENATEKEKAAMKDMLKQSKGIQETSEMTCLEKCRIAFSALNAPSKAKEEKEQEATQFLGEDYPLLKAQILHMEKCLKKDWEKSCAENSQEGISPSILNPTSGKALICPEILAKMQSVSEEQIQMLEDAYSNMAFRKEEENNPEEAENERISFMIGAMTLIEQGKKAKYINKIQGMEKEAPSPTIEDLDNQEEEPDHKPEKNAKTNRIRDSIEAREKAMKRIKNALLQAMAGTKKMGIALATGHATKEVDRLVHGLYGTRGQETLVQQVQEAHRGLDHA
jgi:hypothetical protein